MKKLTMLAICLSAFIAAIFIAGCGKSGGSGEPLASDTATVDISKEPSVRTNSDEAIKVINFAFDRSDISAEATQILKENADYLTQNPNTNIIVEGHCDNRGTVAYNLALGQRRAMKVKEYYVSLGIASNRIATISYGEEKPIDPGENESAYAKNRRAETKIVSK